ncbi:MAG: OmpA family protein [Nitrospirota bacterium]|nr:OmpA family protein [Nitrospirota bacterium]MDH5585105.1 OmpA family protein [Nitrospirota bacterium]
MLLRLLGIILVCSAWGCESFSASYHTSDATESNQPKPTLTSLAPGEVTQSPAVSDRMAIPDEVIEERPAQELAEADPFPTVYFPFDSWEITPEVQERLDATAKWMTHYSTYGLMIEGHADIRGSESYNMVLGVKRAKAVKDYLSNLGIPRTRLDIVSYGNTLVLCDVDDEHRCHQFNRRADLLLE